MKKLITNNYTVVILENKINSKFWKEYKNNKEEILKYLTINKIADVINNRFDKIKIVKEAKYNKQIIYEYKIIINKNDNIRIAYSIDYQNEKIYILGLCILTSKLRKNIFDSLIRNNYKN